jgi:hypothetical protein
MTLFSNDNNTPTARLSGSQLVLSLPDAMTPVVWMMNTHETGSFFMRVEQDDNGLFILQKVSGTGKTTTIEDVAYYSDKSKAVIAMNKIGTVLDQQTNNNSSKGTVIKTFILTGLLFTALFFTLIYAVGRGWILTNPNISVAQLNQQQQQQAPIVSDNPNAVGVPMSADEYLGQGNNTVIGVPF